MTESPEKSASPSASLRASQKFAYSAGTFAAAIGPMMVTSWLLYFYHPPEGKGLPVYLDLGVVAVLNLLGSVVNSIMDPLTGFFSDRTRSRWGRRMPFIIFGTPGLAISFALIWFTLTDYPSVANALFLALNLCLFWFFYPIVVGPHLSLMPEVVTDTHERITLGEYMAYFDVAGRLVAAMVFPILIEKFIHGVTAGPLHLKDGYKLVGIIGAALTLVCFYLTWWKLKETPHSESKEVDFSFYQAVGQSLKNPVFPNYISCVALLMMAVNLVLAVVPYFTVVVIGKAEDDAGILQGMIIVGAALFFPLISKLAHDYGKKKIFATGVLWFGVVMPLTVFVPLVPESWRFYWAMGTFLLSAPGASAMLVLQRPIITDVMDLDERLTGFRREAMYNGVEGLFTKIAGGLSPVIIAILFGLFGGSVTEPMGIFYSSPVAAAIFIAAFLCFKPYPIEK